MKKIDVVVAKKHFCTALGRWVDKGEEITLTRGEVIKRKDLVTKKNTVKEGPPENKALTGPPENKNLTKSKLNQLNKEEVVRIAQEENIDTTNTTKKELINTLLEEKTNG